MELKCQKCQKPYPTKAQLKQHFRKVHKIPLMCHKCLLPVKTTPELDLHKEKKHGIKKSQNKCELCGRTFSNFSNRMIHINNVHDGQGRKQNHKCGKCNREFSSSDSKRVHQEKCGVKMATDCDICKQKFKSHGNMMKHKTRSHSKRNNFSCDICNEEFAFVTQLKAHKEKHDEAESYECEKCEKSFVLKMSLKKHRASHFRMKKNNQQNQIKIFTPQKALDSQELGDGNQTNILKCAICTKYFGKRSTLLNHFSIYHQSSIKCTSNILSWYQ